MSYSLGSATITPGVKGTFTGVNSGIQGIVIGNLSGYSLSIQLEGGATGKTLYPGTADFFPYFYGFSGVIFWVTTSTVNVQNIPGSSINFDAVGKTENFNSSVYPMSIAVVQAVNPTATGNPIFSAVLVFGATASAEQQLNVFNPANSGINCVFHLARGSSSTAGSEILGHVAGADQNLTGGVITPVSHTGSTTHPTSVTHCTFADNGGNILGIAGMDFPDNIPLQANNVPQDLIPFPDTYTLYPGNNLQMAVSETSGSKVYITLKWTEITQVPPLTIVGPGLMANILKNDGNPVGTQIIESTPSGAPQALSIFNDGSGTWAVDQSGVAHKVFTFNTSGNPLQLGQASDVLEALGSLIVDSLMTVLNNNGYSQQNSTGTAFKILNLDGSNVLQLSNNTGANNINFNVNSVQVGHVGTDGIHIDAAGTAFRMLAGSLSRVVTVGDTTIANAGTSVAHSLGVIPDFVVPVHDLGAANADVIGINFGTMSATNFTAYSSNAGGSGNVRFIVIKLAG